MKQLEADIKNKRYKNLYVLYGIQSYNRKRYLDALIKVFLPDDDGMNLTRYYGKKIDLTEVAETVSTMPFFAERRVVVLEETELFTKTCDELCDILENIPESTVVIFSEEKADMRLRQTKTAKNAGSVAEFGNLTEDELREWVMARLVKEHRPFTKDALDLFIDRCGTDMWAISNDLEKIISYTFGKDGIRAEDIEALFPAPPEDKIFAMIDAILDGNAESALSYYKDLVLLRTDSGRILSLLRDQFRIMLHAKEMTNEHLSTKQIAADLGGLKESRVRMALSAAKKSSKISLIEKITKCADTDTAIRSGRISQQLGTETLIIELCR